MRTERPRAELSAAARPDVDGDAEVRHALRVRVETSGGAPCEGANVDLEWRFEDGSNWVASEATDAEGLVEFPRPASAEGLRAGTRVAFASGAPTTVEIDPDAPELARLVLPPHGTVVVRLTGPAGEALQAAVLVSLRAADEETDEEACLGLGAARTEGRLRVGLGRRLRATVLADGCAEAVYAVAGPTVPGEEVVAELETGARLVTVYGRLVRPDGRPVPSRTLWIHAEHGVDLAPATGRTEEDGRFQVELPMDARVFEGHALRLRVFGSDEGLRVHGNPVGAEVNVGDVVVDVLPVLVAGRVVRPDGTPVAGLDVRVECSEDGMYWDSVRPSCETGDDGGFRIVAEVGTGRHHLAVDGDGIWMEEWPEFEPGAEDLRVVVHPAAGLEGRILVPDGFPVGELEAHVEGEAGRTGSWVYFPDVDRLFVPVSYDGTFAEWSVRPGVGHLVVTLEDDEPIVRIGPLRFVAGETLADPRVREVDLRPLLSVRRLLVADEQGRPVPGARVAFSRRGLDDWTEVRTAADGGAVVGGPRGAAMEVEVAAPGHETVRMDLTSLPERLVLRREVVTTVRVALPADVVLARSPARIEVGVRRVEPQDGQDSEWHTLDAAGEATFDVTGTGRFRVSLYAVAEPGDDWRQVEMSEDVREFVVSGDEPVVEVVLPVGRESILDALQGR